jgi:hypothetical protein
MNNRSGLLLLFLSLGALFAVNNCRKSDYIVNEEYVIRDLGQGTGTTTWIKGKSYILEGLVFVNNGQDLTIEAGTIIRARTGQGTAASALIVARGGKIVAEGTISDPIIFTCEGDDLKGSVPIKSKGLWGGLIILGNARLNSAFNENSIEGIPVSEPRSVYGGNDDDDDSGILKYISIRHGGTNIGEGNEINGLTLGGVGRKTIIEHIEVISNADDGFEFFGGTVNSTYLIAAFCGDDAFDYDEGYRGNGQFWLAIQDSEEGDNLLECNGGIYPENGIPYSIPSLYNLTLIGTGPDSHNSVANFNRNAGGILANSIMVNQESGILIEYKEDVESSYNHFLNNKLQIKNNIFFDVKENDTTLIFNVYAEDGTDISEQNKEFRDYFFRAYNTVKNPGIQYSGDQYSLIPRDIIFTNLAPGSSDWFDPVNFKGAFGTYNWAANWTLLSQAGVLKD